ncbi:MAG: phosphatase PAP2 family protein [Putridiphycobacter sp.]|nr:phosphatase PAP2 family protein [Putridiphycobacter sp.]
MTDTLEYIDQQLFLFLNGLHTPILDTIMWYVSTIKLWIPLFIIILIYAFNKGKWQLALIVTLGVALNILLADRISVELFKEVFQRYRPTHNLDIRHLVHTVQKPNGNTYLGGQFGFVSSHAANFFAITTFLVFMFRRFSKLWYLLFLWAALIAYSRIYLGVHYPSDVLVGGLLGMLIGTVVYYISKSIITKYGHLKT